MDYWPIFIVLVFYTGKRFKNMWLNHSLFKDSRLVEVLNMEGRDGKL